MRHQVKGKGRPVGAIATTSAASRKKGAGVNSTKRLPSAFEYNIEDELTTAVPAPKQQQQQHVTNLLQDPVLLGFSFGRR